MQTLLTCLTYRCLEVFDIGHFTIITLSFPTSCTTICHRLTPPQTDSESRHTSYISTYPGFGSPASTRKFTQLRKISLVQQFSCKYAYMKFHMCNSFPVNTRVLIDGQIHRYIDTQIHRQIDRQLDNGENERKTTSWLKNPKFSAQYSFPVNTLIREKEHQPILQLTDITDQRHEVLVTFINGHY